MAAGSNNIVTDGLIACWDAGNRRSYPGAGDSWAALGAGSGGTLNPPSGPTFVSDKMGYITFDGTDDYAEFQLDTMTLSEGSSGSAYDESTIVLWVQWGPGDTNGCILAANHPSGGDTTDNGFRYSSWGFYNSSGGDVKWISGVGDTGATDWGLAEGEWAQITIRCRFGSSGNPYYNTYMKVWINGIEVYDGGGPSGYYLNEGAFRIASGEGACWEGSLASIHVYNRELTADEVSQNYEATKPRFEPRIPKEGLMYYVDAGDPLCYDGNLANYYAPGTYNLRDLAEGAIGEFSNMNSQYPFFVNANGGYWELDGTNDKICPFAGNSGTPYSRYTTANGITGIMWINLAEDSTNIFFWKDDTFQFRYDNSNKLNMRSGNGTSWSTSADLKSAADLLAADGTEWACVAALANKSNDAREIWLNGERVANDTGSGMVWGTNNNIMGVGSESLGDVAMALLYERALSAAEIKDFYNKTKARFGH